MRAPQQRPIFAWPPFGLGREDFSAELTPPFWAGVIVRVLLILLFIPSVQETLFIPFMRETIAHLSFDPWGQFIASGGAGNAFPYGASMYLAHLPTVALGMGIDAAFGGDAFTRIGFAASLFIADYAVFIVLCRLFENRHREVAWIYWLSPIVLYATYFHGQTDIIPIAFLSGALLALRRHWAKSAGVLVGMAISAKLSMLLAAPFLFLFAVNNRQFRPKGRLFLVTAAITTLVMLSPFAYSAGARAMTLASPEIGRLYELALPLGAGVSLYLFILGYAAVVYGAFAVGRINFDLLFALMGVGFLAVLTLAPAAPGWFVWAAPFLVGYVLRSDANERPKILVAAFTALFLAEEMLVAAGPRAPMLGFDLTSPLATAFDLGSHPVSIIVTLRTAAGLILALSIWRRGVSANDFFRLSRKPIAVGIAGDSGAGKDTLARALAGLFSPNSVISISGDDYHRYERDAPAWRTVTHLDPRANDLKALTHDLQSLIAERSINRRSYDHETGRFTPFARTRGNDVVLVSGLHAFYTASLRELYDTTVFLDMDDALRRHFKIKRDVGERGYDLQKITDALERRAADRERFIQPQRHCADIVFSLRAANPERLERRDAPSAGPLVLSVRWREATDFEDIERHLIVLCGVRIEQSPPDPDGFVKFEVEGEIEAEDIRIIAEKLAPEGEDLLGPEPAWERGSLGVMQLVIVMHLIRQMRRRVKDR